MYEERGGTELINRMRRSGVGKAQRILENGKKKEGSYLQIGEKEGMKEGTCQKDRKGDGRYD